MALGSVTKCEIFTTYIPNYSGHTKSKEGGDGMPELSTSERIAAKRRQQDPNELYRKAQKAARSGWWTQEDIDYLKSDGISDHEKELHEKIFGVTTLLEGESS